MPNLDVIGVFVGATLTIFVLTYLAGDNFLYRLTLHIFLGALVGYVFGITIREVWGRLIAASPPSRPTPLRFCWMIMRRGRKRYRGLPRAWWKDIRMTPGSDP